MRRWWFWCALWCMSICAAEKNPSYLIVGTSLDLSRGGKTNGEAIEAGIRAVFEKQSIPALQLQLDARDDGYMSEKALENVNAFIKEHIDILLMPFGSAMFKQYFDLIKQGKILVLFPNPGTPDSRSAAIRYCINLRPSYDDEASTLARYVLQQMKPKKVALFYQDDEFGLVCFNAAQKIFKDAGVVVVAVSYPRNNVNFGEQIKILKTSAVDAIGLFATTTAARALLHSLDDTFLRASKFFAVSDVGCGVLNKFIQDKGLQIIISNVVPNPEKSDIPLVKEYRDAMREKGRELDTFSLEAYIGATVLVDILSHVAKPITKEKIIDAIESRPAGMIKGFPIQFNKEKRQLINTVWLNTGKDTWETVSLSGGTPA